MSTTAFINSNVFKHGIEGTDGTGLIYSAASTGRTFYVVLMSTLNLDSTPSTFVPGNVIATSGKLVGTDCFSTSFADNANVLTMNKINYNHTLSLVPAATTAGVAAVGFEVIEYTGSTALKSFTPDGETTVQYYPDFTTDTTATNYTVWMAGNFATSQVIYNGNNFSISATNVNILAS